MTGVYAFFSAKDIPGDNSFAQPYNPLFAIEFEKLFVDLDSEVCYYGQPCGIVVANTMDLAYHAAKKVEMEYEKVENVKPITPSLKHWDEQNRSKPIESTISFTYGPNSASEPHIFGAEKKIKGDGSVGGQYHYTMEAQQTFCTPNDDGGVNLYTSSQYIDYIQIAVSKMLKLPQSKIYAYVKRMGGGFGGKLTRCSQVACACALACHLIRLPVRFVLTIEANMITAGKCVEKNYFNILNILLRI